jgi:hypothetical protein
MVGWFYGADFCDIFTGSVCFRGDGIGEGEGLMFDSVFRY